MNLHKDNRGSFKVVYLITIGVIATACVILGMVIHMKGVVKDIKFGPKWHISLEGSDSDNGSYSHEADSTVTGEFSAIDVDIDLGKVDIKSGNEFKVEFDYDGIKAPEVFVENKVLHIEQKGNADISLISIPKKGQITVTVPSGTKLESIEVDAALGEITITNVDASNIDIDADLGNVDIRTGSGEQLVVDAAMGDIKINADHYNTYRINDDMGDITVNGSGEFIEVDDSMGEIGIFGAFSQIRAEASMGDVEVENSNANDSDVDISTSMGDVKYNGKKYGTEFRL